MGPGTVAVILQILWGGPWLLFLACDEGALEQGALESVRLGVNEPMLIGAPARTGFENANRLRFVHNISYCVTSTAVFAL